MISPHHDGGSVEEVEPSVALAGAFVVSKARALDDALGGAAPRVLRGGDSEAVHDLRVALRRLRTLLRLARPLFGRFHADAVRHAFAELQTSSGELRDEEVLVETLDGLAVEHDELAPWRSRRLTRERRLRRRLVRRIRVGHLDRARELLHALLTLPINPERDRPLHKFARRAVARAEEEVARLRDAPIEDVAMLHELRIAYKKLRYATEIFAEALPVELAARAEAAAKFQKRLGDLHDVDVARVSIRRARGLTPEARGVLLAALEGSRSKRVVKYLGEMRDGASD